MKILNVVGARPNFMKISPLMAEYKRHNHIHAILVHTGQHYDQAMSHLFFDDLGIPQPDINLEVGSASHAAQTAEIMKRFEPVLIDYQPDVVVVVGDVNSTIACGLVAVKLGIKLAHVEAGLRSFDRSMPEEINRVLTDSISDLLFCTEQSGVDNLIKEGISQDKIHMVGHVMIDTLLRSKQRAQKSDILNTLKLNPEHFAVLTLHRPSNVDDPAVFNRILDALAIIQKDIPIIFPVHPRTRRNLDSDLHYKRIEEIPGLRLIEPLGYLDFLQLMSNAKVVLTDSGGIQEETTILKIPCLTLRETTERPVTTQLGTNQIVGTNPTAIIQAYKRTLNGGLGKSLIPPLWDGKAAQRIVRILINGSF
jgi:UDP-N-acetylglucosamine 2-epimerase (non-hydrolysing)